MEGIVKSAKPQVLSQGSNLPCVIYVTKTKNLEDFAEMLQSALPQLSIATMHKSLAEDTRNMRRVMFGANHFDVLCTTDVTGAGIDWRNVRTSIHWGAVQSIHLLIQHLERAGSIIHPHQIGRDGEPALGCWFAPKRQFKAEESDQILSRWANVGRKHFF